jgi:murein DD-endopeptidase MepM/ murein hydrolase activator NlpD
VRRIAHLVIAAFVLVVPAAAKRKIHAPDSVFVKPSELIESRVADEVHKADALLGQLTTENLFESPYLVSAVYYHDGFLSTYPADRPDLDPSGRIVAHIGRLLSAERKQEYIALLTELYRNAAIGLENQQLVLPVPDAETGRRRRRRQPHKSAIDLFVPEETPVRSVARGIVILAEGGWNPGDPFSTSSLRGGNSVIAYSPETGRFYRYCHLDSVTVTAGTVIDAGQEIGEVGHTGVNASRKGHGRHLHFEVNEFDGQHVRALDKNQLQALLHRITQQMHNRQLFLKPSLSATAQ